MAEHPIETARKALREAADLEPFGDLRTSLQMMARSLPDRRGWTPPKPADVHELRPVARG